ncbi:MAG: lytic transglycosylase domain-containing protein [Pseudomonadota bacterium]
MAACYLFTTAALAQGDGDVIAPLAPERPETLAQALSEAPDSLRGTLDSLRSAPLAPADIWASRQWLNDMEPRLARYLEDPARRRELLGRIHHEARLAGLAPALVLAVIQVESAFQVDAVSSAGAVGLMQIMPFWVRELGLPADDLRDPGRNLRYGCTILAHYLAVEGGDLTRALARYNGSLGQTWYPERVMRALARHWSPSRPAPVGSTAER